MTYGNLTLEELEVLDNDYEEIQETSKSIEDLEDNIELADTCKDSLETQSTLLENSDGDNNVLALVTESMKLTRDLLGIQDESKSYISSEDAQFDIKGLLETIIKSIIAAFYKLVAWVKKIAVRIATSNLIFTKLIEELITTLGKEDKSKSTAPLSAVETRGVFNRYGTVIAASGYPSDLKEIMDAIVELNVEICTPKISVKAGNKIVDIVDNIIQQRPYDEEDVIYTEIDELCPSSLSRSVLTKYLISKAGGSTKPGSLQEHASCVEFYGMKCAGVMVDKKSVYYATADNIESPRDMYERYVKYNNKEGFDTRLSVSDIERFVKSLSILNRGYGKFKSSIDNSVKLCDVMLKHIETTNMNKAEGLPIKSKLEHTMSIVNQYSRFIPKLANANILNYFHFIRNNYWLAKTCANRLELMQVGYHA